jgi:hypothetical protein
MNCQTAQTYRAVCAGHQLPADIAPVLANHLATCPLCAPTAQLDARLAQAMQAIPVPADGSARLTARLAHARRRSFQQRALAYAAGVTLLSLSGAGWWWWQTHSSHPADVEALNIWAMERNTQGVVEQWLTDHGVGEPLPFDLNALTHYGVEEFLGRPEPMLHLVRGTAYARVFIVPVERIDARLLNAGNPARGDLSIGPYAILRGGPGQRFAFVVLLAPGATLEMFLVPEKAGVA